MMTLGVAIAVPEPFGSQLREKRAAFGDCMAETVPSHVTLMLPMEVDQEDLADVCRTLKEAAAKIRPFHMRLHGTGTFRPISPVVYVEISEGVPDTEILATSVRKALGAPEPDFPFHPHVTVAHNVDDGALDRAYADLSDFECSFEVGSFHLYRFEDAAGWTPKLEFPLGSDM
ncbi:MAG: 2'-5' RNA ligase family protein [Aeromicrobium sp.]